MEFMDLLGVIPTALAPVALVLWFNDQNTKNWMNERRDIALAILTERKEFIAAQERLLERYDTRLVNTVESMARVSSELQTLKGTVLQIVVRLDSPRHSKE